MRVLFLVRLDILARMHCHFEKRFHVSLYHCKFRYLPGGRWPAGEIFRPGCNGVEATIFLVSAVLAFPSPWRMKLIGIVAGFVAIQAMNLLRIISLFYIGQWNQTAFEWAHLYIWQSLITLDVLIVFLLWLRHQPVGRAIHAVSTAE